MKFLERVTRLEEGVDPRRCRRCGGRHVDDVATLLRLRGEPACTCGCCGWIGELADEATR